jgi:acyl-CoA thioesterase FadM
VVLSDAVSWIETYRGTVYRWELDNVDHFTVGFYFQRFADATLGLLESLELGPPYMARTQRGLVPVDAYVRYFRELRVGDLLHIESGVIDVDDGDVVSGHKLFDSDGGAVCATIELRARHVELAGRVPVPLSPAQEAAARARRVAWDGPPRERRAVPGSDAGFVEAGREYVKPWEIDAYGQSAMAFYVHRFAAANGHAIAAFGMTPAYQREQRRGFSTFEFQLEFLGDLRAGDPVVVRTGLLHVGTSSLRVFHRMSNPRTGALVATLDQLGVHLDMDARRPTPLPDDLKARAQALRVALPA